MFITNVKLTIYDIKFVRKIGYAYFHFKITDIFTTNIIQNSTAENNEILYNITFMKLLIQFIVFIKNVSLVPELYTLRRLHKERFFVCLQGDYRVDAKITDTNTGEEVACYHVEVSATQPPCSGFLCNIFG